MRYDKPVYVRYTPTNFTYNPNSGNYDMPNVVEEKKYVNIQGAETTLKTQELGGITEEEIAITFQQPPKRPFSSIRYGDKIYRIESALYPKNCLTFVAKEVK